MTHVKQPELKVEVVPTADLVPYANNAKLHSDVQVDTIVASMEEFGNCDPIAVWHNDAGEMEIVEGHGRLLALQKLGVETCPVICLDHLSDAQRRAYVHVHNQTTLNSGFDLDTLAFDIADLPQFDWDSFGFEVGGDFTYGESDETGDSVINRLEDDFLVPPFSILDAKQGRWMERKRLWNALIADSGERGNADLFSGGFGMIDKNSMLDPVLSEVVCRWFMPQGGGSAFDCFAGDTAFGFVSSYLGNNFTGIELRQEQCDDNLSRCAKQGLNPRYICDDGRNVAKYIPAESQDLFFSCPPYFDLEVYSDKENDASNQKDFDSFYAILDATFCEALKCLKPNRFAVVVCTDIRRKDGFYYDFAERVRGTFEANGAGLYNHMILADPIGSAATRARRAMRTRKPTRVHQDVLVFFKGNPRRIKDEFGEVSFLEGDDLEQSPVG